MLSRAEVIAAYRAVLGRDPESEQAIELHRPAADVAALGRTLLGSGEFATALARRRLGPEPLWVKTQLADGTTFWADLHDSGVSAGVLRGAWEPSETAFMLSLVRPGDTVLDVGANIGWFAVRLAQAAGPGGHVHAFEPRSDLFAWLSRNVAENGLSARCTLHPSALGAAAGEADLAWLPAEANPGHSFLAPPGEPAPDTRRETVRVARLDDVAVEGRVRLIKLDVEGAEPDVLAGGMELLRRDRPVIVSEVFPRWLREVGRTRPEAFLSMLSELGYTTHRLTERGVGAELRFPPADLGSDGFYYSVVFLSEADRAALLDPCQDDRVRDLEARLAAASPEPAPAPRPPEVLASDLEAATRRAEAAELRCADLAAQVLHQPAAASPRVGASRSGASQPGAEQLRAELAAMRASTSWRLTAPLRAVVRRVRR